VKPEGGYEWNENTRYSGGTV